MKIIKSIPRLQVVIILLSLFSTDVFAHPGRTDSDGGHTCRTNCPFWGLDYGEYHYHSSGYSSSGNSNESSVWPVAIGLGVVFMVYTNIKKK